MFRGTLPKPRAPDSTGAPAEWLLIRAGHRGWILPRQTAARVALHCKLQLVVSDDAEQVSVDELVRPGTRTLNGDLAATFRRWYSAWSLDDQPGHDSLLARLIAPVLVMPP